METNAGRAALAQRPDHPDRLPGLAISEAVEIAATHDVTQYANHAIKGAIVEALRCKAEGRSEVILFNLCGHGHFDMAAYSDYFAGKLSDQSYDEAELAMALAGLPSVAT